MSVDPAAAAAMSAAHPPGLARRPLRQSEAQASARPGSRAWPHDHDLEVRLLLEARAGRGDARARLVKTFTPLIGSAARTYSHVPGVDRSELMQEGVVGVLRALGFQARAVRAQPDAMCVRGRER